MNSQLAFSQFPLINAVINYQQEGIIYPLGNETFVMHKAGFSLYSSKEQGGIYNLFNLINSNFNGPQYFHVYDAAPALIHFCQKASEHLNIRLRKRFQLRFLSSTIPEIQCPIGYYIEPVTKDNFAAMRVFGLELADKFWASENDFLSNGFGFCVFNQETTEPASICYTACVSNGLAEVDVVTLSKFIQKGLAKSAVAAYVQHCLENNITANWDCFEENKASLKTARTLGFMAVYEYQMLSIFNKNNQQ